MPGKALDRELMTASSGYRRSRPGTQPEYWHPPYASSESRSPRLPLVFLPHTQTELTGPKFTERDLAPGGTDLTQGHHGAPIGERIVVSGRVLDEDGRPMPDTLIEIWQANAAGRYLHRWDQHNAPLDPNFTGQGAMLTDAQGGYRFVSIRPGCYPWRNHHNAWRPAHIHFSVFGPAFATRLVTQMYFPGDPLLASDPIFNCTADEAARRRLIAAFDWQTTIPETALGYRFDLTLRGQEATPMDPAHFVPATTSQTVGPFFEIGLAALNRTALASASPMHQPVVIEGRVLDANGKGVPDACLEIWQADREGNLPHGESGPAPFRGFGRIPTTDDGSFRLTTVKPGTTRESDGTTQAPHLAVSVFMRGLLKRLVTRIYFPGESTNSTDAVLGRIPATRRGTLVAQPIEGDLQRLRWDIVLQGHNETVFFDC